MHSYRAESQERSRYPPWDSQSQQHQQRQRRGPSTSQPRNQDTGNRYDSRSIDRHGGRGASRYDRSQSYATGVERMHHNNETNVDIRRGRSASVTSSRSESFLHRRRQFLSGSRSRSPGRMLPRPPLKMEVVEWPPCFDYEGSAFIFHPASGMFYEGTSDFFYDPKTKLYYGVKKAAYYRYDESQDPPFVESQRANPTLGTPVDPLEPPVTLPSVSSAALLDNKPKIAIHLKTKKIKKHKSSVNTMESESNLIPVPTKVHKEQVANIEKWQEKQAELKAHPIPPLPPPPPPPSMGVTAAMAAEEIKTTVKGEPICVICKRKFPTIEKLRLHETKSDLHKANLAKMTQLSVAIVESGQSDTAAAAAGDSSSVSAVETQNYHDRAEKRRRLHGPEAASSGSSVVSGKSLSVAKHETPEGIAESNVGNVLLQKMGWQSGSALGRKGEDETAAPASLEIRKDWDRIEAMASRSSSAPRSMQ